MIGPANDMGPSVQSPGGDREPRYLAWHGNFSDDHLTQP